MEYINKAELIKECNYTVCLEDDEETFGISEARIDLMPTIDIVTCDECKHNENGRCRKIPMGFDIVCYDQWVEPEDVFFCKYGERKDDDNRY